MLTLAIETATDRVGCALADDGGVVATFELWYGRRHVETLLPAIDACLALVDRGIGDVGAIVADVGPGLFTGLRVGLATARSLAFALELPVVGVTSVEVLAHGARLAGDGRLVCAAIDARRGEVFWQLFRVSSVDDAVHAIGRPACTPPDELAATLRGVGEATVVAGDALQRHGDALVDVRDLVHAGPEHEHPSPAVLATLGWRALCRGLGGEPHTLEPLYLRAPDAAINWTTRDGAVRA